MVFTRTRITIWDQIYRPRKSSIVRYKGPNTSKAYKKVYRLIKSIFNVPSGYIQEKLYNWENDKDKQRFSIRWQVDKPLDQYTYIDWDIELKGFEANRTGEVVISIEPRLITEYPQDTIWEQSIFYEMLRRLWHVLFYEKKREEFFELGKSLTQEFEEKLRDELNKLKSS
ncbi:MAG: hypothetical protein J7J92_03825 [Candidatus Aenigmarchaeota archaeon]|nr:hypothetical protein [Candidatus Aenigmarchaeota archaeon]